MLRECDLDEISDVKNRFIKTKFSVNKNYAFYKKSERQTKRSDFAYSHKLCIYD